MDPLIFCGLCGVASAGAGYVLGSAMFRSLWKFFNKDMAQKMQEVCWCSWEFVSAAVDMYQIVSSKIQAV